MTPSRISAAPETIGSRELLAEAVRLQREGRYDEAEATYSSLLAASWVDPVTLVNAGALALVRGEIASAVSRLEQAVAQIPENAVARNNLGFALLHVGRHQDALAALDRAVELKPDYAQAHNNRGIALVHLGRRDDAIAAFERAVSCQPDYAAAAINLGNQYGDRGDGAAATAEFERVLAATPDNVDARVGHAFAQALTGDLDGSIAALARVVAEHPRSAVAWQNLGAICNWRWRHDEANAACLRALELDPLNAEAPFGVVSTLLALGRYPEGFAKFEERADGVYGKSRQFPDLPVWDGRPMTGTLLLHGEQGLGDVVQFCRFVPQLRPRVDRIVLMLTDYWAPLAPLLASLPGVDRIVTKSSALADERIAARASTLSLPYLASVTVDTIPSDSYLTAPSDRIERWRTRIAVLNGCRVGLAWAVTARDRFRYFARHKSLPPDLLAPVLDTPGVTFATLQPGDAGDPSVFGSRAGRIADLREHIHDFGDTAAAIDALDLVISVDTAVAHVAGALGKPVWLLNPFNCCWRWRLEPRTSPWYRSMRIFRQTRFGDWTEPVAMAAEALSIYAPSCAERSG